MTSRYAVAHVAFTSIMLCAGGCASSSARTQPLEAYTETLTGTLVTFDMAPVPGGRVVIDGRGVDVAPLYVGRTEVTWDMYDVYMLRLDRTAPTGSADAVARPSMPYAVPDYEWGHDGYAAISIAAPAAARFAEWLSAKTGKQYRLPTEAEWQHIAYLAAAGSAVEGTALDAIAWHAGNAGRRTHPVASKRPDALGLHDLFGNAAEWVTTAAGGYVTRGGSFRDAASEVGPHARAAQDASWTERDPQLPKSRWWLSDAPFVGFRMVRDR